jgi:hypothetical protein
MASDRRVEAQPSNPCVATTRSCLSRYAGGEQYTGKIMSQNGVRFGLRDDSNDPWYYLDDQEQASKYLGESSLG